MAFFNREELKSKGTRKFASYNEVTASLILEDSNKAHETFDIFLSHPYLDKDEVLNLKDEIEAMGYTLYVDWIVDKELNRKNVTKRNADILRDRMVKSSSLIYIVTENSSESRWMPWELGFYDGYDGKGTNSGKVAIMPIKDKPDSSDSYNGTEYLGLYPYIVKAKMKDNGMALWVHRDAENYVTFKSWLQGEKP
jgi:hypothetical protein